MDQSGITPGEAYAVRLRGEEELQRVRVIEKVRSAKWKVEFLDEPNPGLVDYVRSIEIVCRWSERRVVLRDERRVARLRADTDSTWPGWGPVDTAVMYVLDATGEGVSPHRGLLSVPPDVADRLFDRTGVVEASGLGFIDRHGVRHVAWGDLERIAHALCLAEPETVLTCIEQEERTLAASGRLPGEGYMLDHLRSRGPAFALIRQWVGVEQERLATHKELDRLRQLVWRAIWELRRHGNDRSAATIERALGGS